MLAKLAKSVLEPANYRSGPVWLNRAGWQVARVVARHAAHAVRRRPTTDALIAEGEASGMVVIPNFLAPEQFERLRNYCVTLRNAPSTRYEPNRGQTGLDFTTSPIVRSAGPEAMFVAQTIAGDARLLDVVGALSRRRIRRPPQIGYQLLTMRDGEQFTPDAETILHADRHYPTVKAYFSLNASTEQNGAYVFAPGSHRLTTARLRYEYVDGIRIARSPVKHNLPIPERHVSDMGLTEKTIITEANTLVISNNFGFHRRGYFAPGAVREQLRLVFHYLEEPFYATAIWSALRQMDRANLLPRRLRAAIQYRLT